MSEDDYKLIDLKAQAYDALVNIERWQKILREVNQEISNLIIKQISQVSVTNEDPR